VVNLDIDGENNIKLIIGKWYVKWRLDSTDPYSDIL